MFQGLLPELTDLAQLTFHGPRGTGDLVGDLVVREAFELPERDRAVLVVRQQVEQPRTLFRGQGRQFGRGFVPQDVADAAGLIFIHEVGKHGFAAKRARAALLLHVPPHLMRRPSAR